MVNCAGSTVETPLDIISGRCDDRYKAMQAKMLLDESGNTQPKPRS